MDIRIEWFQGKYPQFNVALASSPDREPFIVVKGCRVVSGSNGEFVSWPATKKDDGKYWNHVYASDAFAGAVLEKAKASMPSSQPARRVPHDDDGPPY